MLYTILEVSRQLSISRQAVYKKLETMPELKPHIKIKNNTKYISEQGLELLRQSLNLVNQSTDSQPETKIVDTETANLCSAKGTSDNQALIEALQKQITDLQSDKQKLYTQVENLTRLNENSQILLKSSNDRLIMIEAKTQQKKGIFERIKNNIFKNK